MHIEPFSVTPQPGQLWTWRTAMHDRELTVAIVEPTDLYLVTDEIISAIDDDDFLVLVLTRDSTPEAKTGSLYLAELEELTPIGAVTS